MRIVLTYDVNAFHAIIKQICLNNGFSNCITLDDGTRRKLPNTTLIGDFESPGQAVQTFTLLAKRVAPNVVIEKIFASPCPLPWWLDSDERC